jgi:uncharacterized protein (UPF0276 family)
MDGPITPLGIGLPYLASLPADLYARGLIDFVEVTPESLRRQRQDGTTVVLDLVTQKLGRARETCGSLPMVVHGVELSIGSAHGCNEAYLTMLDRFQASWPFVWHSEHLGFQTMPDADGTTLEIGVPLPLPPTNEAVTVVAGRSRAIGSRYGVPFALENPAHYLSGLPVDPEIGDDIGLIQAITTRSGCFALLDLHNVYCNAVNHHFDAFAAIDRMPLDRVIEIHIAGGAWDCGFWTDAHNGRVTEAVWDLLEHTLPRTPHVGGIVFEMLEEHAVRLGPDAIADELSHAREVWRRCRPAAAQQE